MIIARDCPASMVNVAGAETPTMLVATTVNVKLPLSTGIPEIMPVFGSNDRPVGRLPLTINQVMGMEPFAVNWPE